MKARLVALLLASAAFAPAGAQAPSPEAEALRECSAMSDRRQPDSAATVGKGAESAFRKRVVRNPRDVEALVGLARTMVACLLPVAEPIDQGAISQEAMEHLENALDLAPTNWPARFVLAAIAYRSPSFLGREAIAARHFDELIRQQGSRASDPMYARPYEYRGMQLMRAGKADSARALWTRGLSLFPTDSALLAIMQRSNAAPPTKRDTVTAIPMMQITARADRAPAAPPTPPAREMSRGEILTTAGGGADVFSAVQVQPGATLVGEGSSVYTRGGDASETATVLDGSRVLSLSRFEGLNGGMFGALEPWIVKSVRYSTGAFSVRHGNALSGIVEIETDGKPRERKTRAGMSLVQASGTAWLPAGRKAGGWVSARVSQTAALLATHRRSAEFDGAPHSEEIIGSFITTPVPGAEVRATMLLENDGSRRIVNAAGWRGPFESKGGAQAVMVGTRWQASAPLALRANVTAARRSSDFRFGILSRERDDRTAATRLDAEYELAPSAVIRSGLAMGAHDRGEAGTMPTSPSVASGAPSRQLDSDRTSTSDRGGYVETELSHRGSMLVLGARADRLPGESETTMDPRAMLSHRSGAWTLRAGGGVFHQGRWRAEAAIPDGGVPSGMPGTARHLVGGVEHEAAGRTFRAELYRKRYSDYRSFGTGPAVASSSVAGMDLLAEHRGSGPVSGWLSYSMLDAVSTLADGRKTSSPYDITHSAGASFTAARGDYSFGMTGRYGTGAPTTPIIGAISDASGFPRPVYGTPMSDRLPHYARADARVMRYFRMPTVLVTSFVEMINLTNRRNVSGVSWDAGYRTREYMHSFFSQRTIVVGAEAQFR